MSAISAKALNSTLGTSDFKGFDELLREIITIPKGLVAPQTISNETLYHYLSDDYIGDDTAEEKFVGKVKFLCRGTARFVFTVLSESEDGTVKLTFYRNGTLFKTFQKGLASTGGTYDESLIVSFAKGDEIEMRYQNLSPSTDGPNPMLYPVAIYAKETNLNGIEG